MAKKQDFSHIAAQEALEDIASKLNAENLPYELLRIFCGYGDASLERVRDGRDNKSRTPQTILVKDKFVYRPFTKGSEPMDVIISLRNDASVTRHNPRLYITSDGENIVAYDPKDDDLYDGTLETLWRDFEFFKPLAGIEKFRNYEEAEADVKTAELMAKLYDDICRYNDFRDPEISHYINIFMSRLLFCFFAEDTGLFTDNQFTKAIEANTSIDGSDLADFIDRIFVILSTNDKTIREQQTNKVISSFPYVNGGLFSERYPIPVLSRRARLLMIQCGKFQWSEINPDIFGSMTQAIVSPEERSELGIHYTSVPNIMKVIQPLFLDDLAAEYLRSRNDIKALENLLARMSKIKFFDPACGSGNFLIITYKRIRELEIEIWKRLFELGLSRLPISEIALTQFYGIEIDEYARDTATLSLWLAEHQMNNKFREELGTSPDPLPLRSSGHIVCGNACTIDWNSVCPHSQDEEVYIMGNPPYLGSSMQNDSQKTDLTHACRDFENYKNLDYIACWFIQGARYIRNSRAKYAFVSTNSITQGEQVALLWPHIFAMDLEISFAYKTFKWSNNAKNNAAVFCVIIGVQNRNRNAKYLYDDTTKNSVEYISAYLIPNVKCIIGRTSQQITKLPEMIRGSMPSDGGFLIMSADEKDDLLEKHPEVEPIIKGYMGAEDFLSSTPRYCLWMNEEDYNRYGGIPEIRIRMDGVRQARMHSNTPSTQEYAKYPWLFRQPQYIDSDSIIVPSTSSERRPYIPVGYLDHNVVTSNSAYVIYNAELWILGLLSSRMHNVWVRAVGGRLKSDYRYTNTICYNSFPAPRLSITQKNEIDSLAKEIVLIRSEHTEMTLGEMYSPEHFPEDLLTAHKTLDSYIERCYREKTFESDEERLEFLFKQYVKLTTDKMTLWRT